MTPHTSADDVASFHRAAEAMGVAYWLDGGWAVDALLGRQTREHSDLDIAIEETRAAPMRAMLQANGYRDVPRDDTHRWNFVLGDARGREIDFHTFVLDAAGNVAEGIAYPRDSLRSVSGSIAGQPIRCLAPESLLKFRTGYAIREKDRHDVRLLCEHFGLELPAEYAQNFRPPDA